MKRQNLHARLSRKYCKRNFVSVMFKTSEVYDKLRKTQMRIACKESFKQMQICANDFYVADKLFMIGRCCKKEVFSDLLDESADAERATDAKPFIYLHSKASDGIGRQKRIRMADERFKIYFL